MPRLQLALTKVWWCDDLKCPDAVTNFDVTRSYRLANMPRPHRWNKKP